MKKEIIEKNLRERVFQNIELKKEEMVGFLRNLISIKSVTGHEGEAQKPVADKMRGMNLEVDIFEANIEELRKHPAFFETDSYKEFGYKNRPNVVGTLKGTGGGRSLILNAHIDVVTAEPLAQWKHDPWAAEVENGKIYGRGSVDDKAGIAVMIYAVKAIQDAGIKLKGDVMLESTIEEEVGGIGGVLATILRGYRADGAVALDAGGGMGIGVATGGAMYFRVKVPGKTKHVMEAHLGVNAIGKAIKIYNALLDLNEYRQSKISYWTLKGRPATTLNPGVIKGGEWPSTVPGTAELICRIGWPPGEETMESVKRQVEDTIKRANELDFWLRDHPAEIEWIGFRGEAAETDLNNPLVQTLKRYAEELTGEKQEFAGGAAAADMRFYILYGNIPTVDYGPALGGNAHSVNEWVEIDSLVTSAKIVALTILDFCGYK